MSAITAKASRKMKKYAVLTREPRCFLGSFDFSWEQRKLGDIGKARSGVGFPDADQGGVTGVPFFKVSDMNLDGNENEMIVANNYVTAEQIADHRWSPITELPAIFFAKVGAAVMLNRKRLCRFPFLLDNNTMAYSLSPTKWDADFAKALFGTVDLTSLVQVGALPSYNAGDVESMGIYLPSLFEQEQIGAFFKLLDNLITLHQRKCVFLFGFFQAFISMIFTASTFSWEQRKLSELTSMHARIGWQNLRTSEFLDSGDYMLITGTDFNDGAINFSTCHYVERERYEQDRNIQIHNGSILITKDGTLGKVAYVQGLSMPATLNAGVFNVQIKDANNVDERYLFQYLKAPFLMDYVDKKATGGTIKHLNQSILVDFPVILPQRSEQILIGAFFQQLDNLITLHQRECISFTARAGRRILTANKKRNTSSWEQRKLGDMMNVTSVKRIHQSDWTDSGVRFLRARDIVAAAKNEEPDDYLYISKEKYEEYSALSGKVGVSDLLVTGVGTIGVPYLVRNLEPLYFKDGNIIWFQNSDKIDGKFLFYSFSAEQIQGFINESAGIGTVGTYTIESGKKTPISLPNQIEQAKVGEYFQQLDNLITLHQRQPIFIQPRIFL